MFTMKERSILIVNETENTPGQLPGCRNPPIMANAPLPDVTLGMSSGNQVFDLCSTSRSKSLPRPDSLFSIGSS